MVRYFDYPEPDKLYERMISFFHASSYSIQDLHKVWAEVVGELSCHVKIEKFNLLVGDGVKVAKSGSEMVCVKKMYQPSASMAKREVIFGQFFGSMGAIIGSGSKAFFIPIETTIQDGIHTVKAWKDPSYQEKSHVVQMMESAGRCLPAMGASILALDRYFLTLSAVSTLQATNESQENVEKGHSIILVTKTRRNGIAFELPPQESPHKRGRKRKKGATIKLYDLFEKEEAKFEKATMFFYGKVQQVEYYSIDRLWGISKYYNMRFVLVKHDGMRSILVSSSDTLIPEHIIEAYSFRWKCEQAFKDAKHTVGTFSSHFWTLAMPRLDRYRRKGLPDPLAAVDDKDRQRRIISNYGAFEKMAMVGNIAQGLLQLLSLKANEIGYQTTKYLRTHSQQVMSEDSMNYELRKVIEWCIGPNGVGPIPRLINPMLAS
ncbi:MAG: hypothetical protein PF495_02590 [Spirochaetales bacterium]|jgi:hypothetical protein|nr:hypothetical protein [Spirochaetales bacterium]